MTQWRSLEPIASRDDWPQPVACRFVSPLLIAPTFQPAQVEPHTRDLALTWWSLVQAVSAEDDLRASARVNLFLPPFVGGVPEQTHTPFIHSTILPNDFDLQLGVPSRRRDRATARPRLERHASGTGQCRAVAARAAR